MKEEDKLYQENLDATVELQKSQINILLSDFLIRIKQFNENGLFADDDFIIIKERTLSFIDEMYSHENRSIFHTTDYDDFKKHLPKLESFIIEFKQKNKDNIITDVFYKQILNWALVYKSINDNTRLTRLRSIINYCVSGKLSEKEIILIKGEVDNISNYNYTGFIDSYMFQDILYWIIFRIMNIIDYDVFCKEIINNNVYSLNDDNKHILLGEEEGIRGFIKNTYEQYGCTVINKSIKKSKVTIVLKQHPYIITVKRYKTFFWRFWKKKIILSDVNGKNYNYSQNEINNVLKNNSK